MTDLTPITALGAAEARSYETPTLSLMENTNIGLASLSVGRGLAQPKLFGLVLPDVGAVTANAQISAFWSGPDQWIIEAHGKAEIDFAAELKSELPNCAITEQTDGFVCFDIKASAERLKALLPKLINIDPRRIAPETAMRTGLDHMTVFVVRRSEDALSIFGMRSLALSLWQTLESAISLSEPRSPDL